MLGIFYLQLSPHFLEKRSRVWISLTTKTRHGSYAHVHTIIHNYCKFNVDHWHHHMLRDSRLRSSEQFGTRQWRKRLLAQKQRDFSSLAFVTAHYKLIREDWALNFRQRGHEDSNPFQEFRTGNGPYKKGPQTKRQVQFNLNQWHDWNHQWVKHSQQFSKTLILHTRFFFLSKHFCQHKQ